MRDDVVEGPGRDDRAQQAGRLGRAAAAGPLDLGRRAQAVERDEPRDVRRTDPVDDDVVADLDGRAVAPQDRHVVAQAGTAPGPASEAESTGPARGAVGTEKRRRRLMGGRVPQVACGRAVAFHRAVCGRGRSRRAGGGSVRRVISRSVRRRPSWPGPPGRPRSRAAPPTPWPRPSRCCGPVGRRVDAVLAAAFAAAVSEPALTSLGGGGFLLHARSGGRSGGPGLLRRRPGARRRPCRRRTCETVVVDFASAGPAAAASEQVFHGGWGTVAVPGCFAGYLDAHRRHGRLPLGRDRRAGDRPRAAEGRCPARPSRCASYGWSATCST